MVLRKSSSAEYRKHTSHVWLTSHETHSGEASDRQVDPTLLSAGADEPRSSPNRNRKDVNMESDKDNMRQEENKQKPQIEDLPVDEAESDDVKGGKHIGQVKYEV